MFAIGLAGAIIIASPPTLFDQLGPEARVVGSKLKEVIDVGLYLPGLRRTSLQ
jgi:hypothetical protein